MSINMTNNFFKLILFFREQNLDAFYEEHAKLHAEARRVDDYAKCTIHYYSLMSTIINQFFSGNFHFVAPTDGAEERDKEEERDDAEERDDGEERDKSSTASRRRRHEDANNNLVGHNSENEVEADAAAGLLKSGANPAALGRNLDALASDLSAKLRATARQSGATPPPRVVRLEDALRHLHRRIGRLLKLAAGTKCVDIGCGIGGVMLDLAETGAQLTGLTITPSDVALANETFRQRGWDATCRVVEAACERHIPLDAASQDAAYAIYALKYFPRLAPVLRETARILRRGGLFVVYDLVKTDAYDESNAKHRAVLEAFEFSCGMPRLHTRAEMIDSAAAAGLRLVRAVDIDAETGLPFHYCFSHSAVYMWLMRSRLVGSAIRLLEWLRLLPRGFCKFNETFLAGTVDKIVTAGEMGILSGGEILLFQKQ